MEGLYDSRKTKEYEVIMKKQDTRCKTQDARCRMQDAGYIIHHASMPLNEKGIALVMVLILSAISLAIMAGLVYMVVTGTQISGGQKRYKTALEAGISGKDVAYQFIDSRDTTFSIPGIGFLFSPTFIDACKIAKLYTEASSTNWASCSDYTKTSSINIDINDPNTYDMQFDLGTIPTYTVYAKIVDTVVGNSREDTGLIKGGVVWAKTEIHPQPKRFYYTIEVDAENAANPAERAKLSILYQY